MVKNGISIEDIRTPVSKPSLLAGQALGIFAARLGLWLFSKPRRVGGRLFVALHADVSEVIRRDLDFRIAPINAKRIEEVNGGPFILGMDRGDQLSAERGSLYRALSMVDLADVVAHSERFAEAKLAAASTEIDLVGGYARPAAGVAASRLFGLPIDDEALFLEVARAIFAHTFLNLGDDETVRTRALAAGELMKVWFEKEIARRRSAKDETADLLGALIANGELDDQGIRRTLGGMFVGSIDTTATACAKIMIVFSKDASLLSAATADADNPVRLFGWCQEALRRWPHNPILLRSAQAGVRLGNTTVPEGMKVFLLTQAAMLDASAFPEPFVMRPDRPTGNYLHFGGELHACAGRAVNSLQIPMLIGKLLRRGVKAVGNPQWAGPFPHFLTITLRT